MVDEKEKTQSPQEQEEGKPEETTTESLFDRTQKVVEEDKQNLKKREELLAREEELLAKKQLAGHADAGTQAKALTQDEKDEAQAKAFMKEDA